MPYLSINALIGELEDRSEDELVRLRSEIERRIHTAEETETGEPVSEVAEYRPHEDGVLQAEIRAYRRKDGTTSRRGPYWYFRYHEGGKQKKMYLGKLDEQESPEQRLAEKRAAKKEAS